MLSPACLALLQSSIRWKPAAREQADTSSSLPKDGPTPGGDYQPASMLACPSLALFSKLLPPSRGLVSCKYKHEREKTTLNSIPSRALNIIKMAQLIGASSYTLQDCGFDSRQGTYSGFGFSPSLGHIGRQLINVSHSLPLSLLLSL